MRIISVDVKRNDHFMVKKISLHSVFMMVINIIIYESTKKNQHGRQIKDDQHKVHVHVEIYQIC